MSIRIKQIIAPTGDWFQLQTEPAFKDVDGKSHTKRIVMSRVCAWALMSEEPPSPDRVVDSFEGIHSGGYGHADNDLDYDYVNGDDLAPNGKTWPRSSMKRSHSTGA